MLFLQGCPWQCRYCHNPHLRSFEPETVGHPEPLSHWTWEKALGVLRERVGFLDGVVFSGGEPTAHATLSEAIKEARALGYRIGLHTAGAYPERLKTILPLLDWVGLDIKAPLDARYDRITGIKDSSRPVQVSLSLLLSSGIPYQLRTTLHPQLHSYQDLKDLNGQLASLGAESAVIQQFRIQGCADPELIASAA